MANTTLSNHCSQLGDDDFDIHVCMLKTYMHKTAGNDLTLPIDLWGGSRKIYADGTTIMEGCHDQDD